MMIEYEDHIAEWQKIGFEQSVSEHALVGLRRVELTTHLDRLVGRMVLRLRAYVLTERLPPQTVRDVVTVPRFAGPWDHFKARYGGRWWMRWRRWPIRYADDAVPVEVRLEGRWMFPEFPSETAEPWRPVRYMEWRNTDLLAGPD